MRGCVIAGSFWLRCSWPSSVLPGERQNKLDLGTELSLPERGSLPLTAHPPGCPLADDPNVHFSSPAGRSKGPTHHRGEIPCPLLSWEEQVTEEAVRCCLIP
jgi:hypothetical protein